MNPEPTILDALAKARNVPLAGRKDQAICDALGLDPDVSVARLREDLAIAARARQLADGRPKVLDQYTAAAAIAFVLGSAAVRVEAASPTEPSMEELIERSSLGTTGAKALRARTPKHVVDEILRRIDENRAAASPDGDSIASQFATEAGLEGPVHDWCRKVIEDAKRESGWPAASPTCATCGGSGSVPSGNCWPGWRPCMDCDGPTPRTHHGAAASPTPEEPQ